MEPAVRKRLEELERKVEELERQLKEMRAKCARKRKAKEGK